MPDLDDIFEDVFDSIKKKWRKRDKSKKKNAEAPARPMLLERLFSGWVSYSPAPHEGARMPASLNQPTSGLDNIQNGTLRGYLEQARAYENGLINLMNNASTDFNRSRLEELTRYVEHWQGSLNALVERVDHFQKNELLQQDLKSVPKAIRRIEAQLEEGVPKRIEKELERTLENRRQQLISLENLSETMQWAEVKIENTLSMLGTIYSQATMSQSKGQVGNYQRLLAEIEEEALSLDDYVQTLEEIKFGDPLGAPRVPSQ